MTGSPKRDPALAPHVGDVLAKRGATRTVIDVRAGIIRPGFFVTTQSSRSGVEVVWRSEKWRDWAATASIVKRGDQP